MALIKSKLIDLSRLAVTTSDSEVVSVTGTHVVTAAETAAAAADDVIQMVKLPHGAKVVDCKAWASIAGGGAADLVQLTDVDGAVIAASTLIAAGAPLGVAPSRLNSAEALDLAPQNAETYASVVLGATPTLPAGTVLSLQLSYRNSWHGE